MEKIRNTLHTCVNVLALFQIDFSALSLEELMQMACLSVNTDKHLLHALFAIQRHSRKTGK